MLKKSTTTNFLSHKKTILTLTTKTPKTKTPKTRKTKPSTGKPRIIALTGTTGSGKSAFMKSLRFLFLFEPPYFRSGENSIEAKAVFDDMTIIRSATKSSKGKKLTDVLTIILPDGTKHEWPGPFHKKIPDDFVQMTSIFNLDIADLNKKLCLNFFSQKDQGLADDFKPAQISKIFGSVSGRNKIDSAIRETNVAVKRQKIVLEQFEKLVTDTGEKVKIAEESLPAEPPDLDDMLKDYYALEEILRLSAQTDIIEAEISEIEEMISGVGEKIKDIDESIGQIALDLAEYRAILVWNKEIPDFQEVDCNGVADACTGIEGIEMMMDEVAELVVNNSNILNLETDMEDLALTMNENDTDQKAVELELKKLLKDGICPFSGEELPTNCKKALVS